MRIQLSFRVASFFIFGLVSACASGPKKPEMPQPITGPKVDSTPFTKGWRGVQTKEKSSGCHLPSSPNTSWKTWVEVGGECVSARNWIFVDRIGQELSQKEPHSPWGPYFLSIAAEARSDLYLAHWMIDLALKKAPQSGVLYHQKSRLFFLEGENELAVEYAQKAVEKDPNLFPAHMFLGEINLRDGDYNKAAFHYQAVLHLSSRDQKGLVGLAECRIQLKDTASALELLSKGISSYPKEFYFRWRRAQLLEAQERDVEQALSTYKGILDLYTSRRLEGDRPRDLKEQLESKIKTLESRLRAVASVADSAPKKKDAGKKQ